MAIGAKCSRIDRGQGNFLGDGKIILVRIFPVDKPDGFRVFAGAGLHFDAVAQQVVYVAIAVVEAFAGIVGGFLE